MAYHAGQAALLRRLTGGLAAAGLFQLMQANLLANEADGITDVSQADEYDALIEEANRRGYTGLALVGSAGVGLVATGVLVLVSRSLKTRTTKAWKQFKASSRVPVSPPIE